jgi:hypothetical protein
MGNSFINGAPQALEHTDLPIPTSTASRAVPTSVAADRSRTPHTLVEYWLRMRLHSWRHRAAREVTEIRATEAAPPAALGLPLAELGEKTMNVKSMIVLAMVVAAVALGACRWEENGPLKLGAGADMPVAEKSR